MSKLRGENDSASSDGKPSRMPEGLYLITSMADTTWRMFVPTIGLLLAGNAPDRQYGTKPWLLLLGVTLGGFIAAALIKQQIKKGKK